MALVCDVYCEFLLSHSELILGFFQKGPTPPLCSQKGANLQIKWVMVFLKKKTLPTTSSSLKKHCRPTLHPLKKTKSTPLKKTKSTPLKKTKSTPKKKSSRGRP